MSQPGHPPLFIARGSGGPGVSFYTSNEDHERKLVMHGQVKPGAEPWCITLERADVQQLRDFCMEWLCAGMTTEEMIAEVDAGLARVRSTLVEKRR